MSKATRTPTTPEVPTTPNAPTNGERLAMLTLSGCIAIARFHSAKRDQNKGIRNADSVTVADAATRMAAAMNDTRNASADIRSKHSGDRTPASEPIPAPLRGLTGELIASALLFAIGADNAATGAAKDLAKVLRNIG